MDILDYTEGLAAKSLEVARKAYDDLHERAYKLATVLVGGGGAIGAYALGRFGAAAQPLEWAPIAALALSWFSIAGLLVIRGATSKDLSPGNGPMNVRSYYDARLAEHSADPDKALSITRNAELDLVQQRIEQYNDGCVQRALAIDSAYRCIASCSPLVPLLVAGLCWYIR